MIDEVIVRSVYVGQRREEVANQNGPKRANNSFFSIILYFMEIQNKYRLQIVIRLTQTINLNSLYQHCMKIIQKFNISKMNNIKIIHHL